MCDYSLHSVASRPAKVADKLTVTKFYGTVTRGFCAEDDREVAVCLLPGTEIAFERPVKRSTGLFTRRKARSTTAIFRQVHMGFEATHHNAVEFATGEIWLVNDLSIGQRATVLQLPASLAEARREEVQTGVNEGISGGLNRFAGV